MVGGEDHRWWNALAVIGGSEEVGESIVTVDLRIGDQVDQQSLGGGDDQVAGRLGDGGAGPVRVVVSTERRRLGRHHDAPRHRRPAVREARVAQRGGGPGEHVLGGAGSPRRRPQPPR